MDSEGKTVDHEFVESIQQVVLHYHPGDLERWRQGDPTLVPADVLSWGGPGRQNGFGFAEFISECYLRWQGYETINTRYDLFAGRSKYAANNARIEEALGARVGN